MSSSPCNCRTILEILEHRTIHQPDAIAFSFLEDGESSESKITYRELGTQAAGVAYFLRKNNLCNERILLLFPPGLDFLKAFFACLYAGAVAVPSYPPRRNRPNVTIEAIINNCDPKSILTNDKIRDTIIESLPADALLRTRACHSISEFINGGDGPLHSATASENDLAFIQYTSGSTSSPKGVMVRHRNIMANQIMIQHGFKNDESTIGASWLPMYHDMGLIGNVLQPIYLGIPLIFMSPFLFLQRPIRWLRMISQYKVTTSGGPNFAYQLCVEKISEAEQQSLDLSRWRVAYCGAEPVRYNSIRRFYERFKKNGFQWESFLPCYGLAEATLFVSGGPACEAPICRQIGDDINQDAQVTKIPKETLVASGRTYEDLDVRIVDPEEKIQCNDGIPGEIWISGVSVCDGYWGNPNCNSEFNLSLSDDHTVYFRTGDIGIKIDGQLFISGRIKDMLIIHGRNLFPEDIEMVVSGIHPDFIDHGTAAFSISVGNEEKLVIVQEIHRHVKSGFEQAIKDVQIHISRQFELQAYDVLLVKERCIPRTSSGKIQRYLCKQYYINKRLKIVFRDRNMEKTGMINLAKLDFEKLIAIDASKRATYLTGYLKFVIADLLKTDAVLIESNQKIDELGLDSTQLVELKVKLDDVIGHEFELDNFVEMPQISELASKAIESLQNETGT